METLKFGSKGEAVKELQRKLGITVDGSYGDMTRSAVKAYQIKHGLTADGIAGMQTLASLGLAVEPKVVDPSVTYSPLDVHITKSVGRPIKYLVIHYTGNSRSDGNAMNTKSVFEKRQASADFVVDDDQIIQFNPDLSNYFCWAVGGANYNNRGGSLYGKAINKNCISIEMYSNCTPNTEKAINISNHKGWFFTEATLENARKLARILMKKYNIDKDHVIRHYDVTGKLCPAVYGWNDEPLYDLNGMKTGGRNNSDAWNKFKASL